MTDQQTVVANPAALTGSQRVALSRTQGGESEKRKGPPARNHFFTHV
jgi:hypothetical protein